MPQRFRVRIIDASGVNGANTITMNLFATVNLICWSFKRSVPRNWLWKGLTIRQLKVWVTNERWMALEVSQFVVIHGRWTHNHSSNDLFSLARVSVIPKHFEIIINFSVNQEQNCSVYLARDLVPKTENQRSSSAGLRSWTLRIST